MTKQEEGQSINDHHHDHHHGFELSWSADHQSMTTIMDLSFPGQRTPQLLCVSLTIVYTCQDHVLESLKMAFFVVILDSKYSKMTPKFVKQKSH